MYKMPPEKLPNTTVPPFPPREHEARPQQHTPVGPIVGIVIIIAILLLGAFYFWGEQLKNSNSNPPAYIPGDQPATP